MPYLLHDFVVCGLDHLSPNLDEVVHSLGDRQHWTAEVRHVTASFSFLMDYHQPGDLVQKEQILH